jgi:glutaredoxin
VTDTSRPRVTEAAPTNPTVQVTLLTQPDCPFCELAAEILARVGHDHLLTVRQIDLDTPDGRDLAARHGVLFAPGVLLDGQTFSYGRLSERRLRRHLARLGR